MARPKRDLGFVRFAAMSSKAMAGTVLMRIGGGKANPLDRLQYHLFHNSYHLGQIMYLRAMQGLKPIE